MDDGRYFRAAKIAEAIKVARLVQLQEEQVQLKIEAEAKNGQEVSYRDIQRRSESVKNLESVLLTRRSGSSCSRLTTPKFTCIVVQSQWTSSSRKLIRAG